MRGSDPEKTTLSDGAASLVYHIMPACPPIDISACTSCGVSAGEPFPFAGLLAGLGFAVAAADFADPFPALPTLDVPAA